VPLVPPRGSAEEARRPGATPELREAHPALVAEAHPALVAEAHPASEASPATNQSGSYGGGLYVTGATVPAQVSNSVISGNSAVDLGGGIAANEAIVEVIDSAVDDQIAPNQAASGGGISASWGAGLTVANSNVSGNQASYAGGGIYAIYGQVTVVGGATVTGNDATVAGGGIIVGYRSVVDVLDSTVAGNTAINGGGAAVGDQGMLHSMASDWGPSISAPDNVPPDVFVVGSGNTYAYTVMATFDCDWMACVPP